ncbi:AAA family ATPase [Caryophanon latum]|uniref:AAA+ ATPase domain-containing protein n=1 Tax=Caryophanon latum TaxID=33977 RepID=A0A1C0YUJ1_9BACL|nr:ATP-binding protein [Caryophanon latum]OCS90848.1 hypothetical protein A6K76_02010 [Caryophanon latum]
MRMEIEDFKSLKQISMDAGQFNVIVGSNGSGKSALLEAIGVLSAAVSGEVSDATLMSRGVRVGTPALYKSSFRNQKIAKTIKFQIENDEHIRYQVHLANPLEKPKPKWTYFSEKLEADGEKVFGRSNATKYEIPLLPSFSVDAERGLLSFLQGVNQQETTFQKANAFYDFLTEYKIYTPYTTFLRGLAADPTQADPIGLNGGRLAEAVADLLTEDSFGTLDLDELFDLIDWAIDIKVAPPNKSILSSSVPSPQKTIRFTDIHMRENRAELTAYDASEGSLYILFILTLALHPDAPHIFSIDNFDQALHPRLARKLTALFSKIILEQNKTCFLTTHNPLVLDGLNLKDDRIRLFAIDRDSEGVSILRRIELNDELINEDLPLSQLWVMGRLGGVPNL